MPFLTPTILRFLENTNFGTGSLAESLSKGVMGQKRECQAGQRVCRAGRIRMRSVGAKGTPSAIIYCIPPAGADDLVTSFSK